MLAGPPSDDTGGFIRGQIDTKRHPVANIYIIHPAHQPDIALQCDHRGIRHRRRSTSQAKLRQARSGVHQNRKGSRRNLGIERALIAIGDSFEFQRLIDNQAGEDIKSSGRAFRVRHRTEPGGEAE